MIWTLQGPNDKDLKKKIKSKPGAEEEYILSRFKPLLQAVLDVNETTLHLSFQKFSDPLSCLGTCG